MTAKTLKEMRNDPDGDEPDDNLGTVSDTKKPGGDRGKALVAGIKGIFRKAFGSKKAVMITVACLILFTGLIAGGLVFFGPNKDQEAARPAAGDESANGATHLIEEAVFEDIVALAPFERIRLKEGPGMKLISLNLSLELSAGRYKQVVHAEEEKIRQIVAEQAERMSWLELRNPEGKIMFKYELLKRMNSIFSEVMIRNIYFTYFVMQ
nr:hypothetical protein [Desulfobacula sp.]